MWSIIEPLLTALLGVVFAPWFLSLSLVIAALTFLYTTFDPIRTRNSLPQNISHYQLPYNNKPSKAVGDPETMMYFYSSATELARFVREKRISSSLLVQKYIDRLIHVNPSINAATNYRFSQAIDEAIICDDIIDQLSRLHTTLQSSHSSNTSLSLDLSNYYSFEDYPILSSLELVRDDIRLKSSTETLPQFLSRYLPPFFGVPCTTKECFALRGMPHTSGLVSRRGNLADYTAPVINNMQSAGLIIIATSNTSELCMWMESDNKVYGQSRNPYALKRTPGGSSGGEGALSAALATTISLGSDVGGSIRMPAFFNGVYGHKPTSNYVSCLGQVPSSRGGIPDFFCQAGPIARFPSDLWPMLQVMSQTHYAPVDTDVAKTNFNVPNQNESENKQPPSILNLSSELGLLGEKRTINLMPRPPINLADVISLRTEYSTTHEGKTFVDPTSKHYHNPHGISGKYEQNQHNPLLVDSTGTQPQIILNHSEDMTFVPYPHHSSKYYSFNALQSYTNLDYPILTSSHPSQVYYNTPETKGLPRINQVTPYQIDCKKVPVFNLRSFGSTFPPSSSVDPILIQRQHEVAQFYANMGLDVYDIDVDELIAFLKSARECDATTTTATTTSSSTPNLAKTGVYKLQKNPNFFIPVLDQATQTDLLQVQPVPKAVAVDPRTMPQLEVFTEFVSAFDYWSAGMTFTFSAFRELLLQDCTVEAFQGVEKVKKRKMREAQNGQVQMAMSSPSPIHQRKNMLKAQNEQIQMAMLGATSSTSTPEGPDCPTTTTTKKDQIGTRLKKTIKINHANDFASDPADDYTSHEVLSKYTTLTQDQIDTLDPIHKAVYSVLLVIFSAFHTLRHFLIKIALPLEGIPHFGDFEGSVETRRQKELRDYKKQQRLDAQHKASSDPATLAVSTSPLPVPSIRDIYPQMPLSHVQSPSMSIVQRLWFELRVATYIIYHLCLSCCSRQLVPTGTCCLAQTQGQPCWHESRDLPWVQGQEQDLTDVFSHRTKLAANSPAVKSTSEELVQELGTTGATHLNMTSRVLTEFMSLNQDRDHGLTQGKLALNPAPASKPSVTKKRRVYNPDLSESEEIDWESDSDISYDGDRITRTSSCITSLGARNFSQSDVDFDPTKIVTKPHDFKSTLYALYLKNKATYSYCNCTGVLQSAKQIQVMTRQHNYTTLATIFSSFLPATPHTFPALLLALIDRVGDLAPQQTLKTFTKCLNFSKNLNQLLAPSVSQPFGAVLLAPPHPVQAPGHFIPCTRPFNFVYTGIFNATMQPVTSVPTGLHQNLPTGLQVVGARHCDATTIGMALLIHEQWGGWQPMKRLHSKYHL